MKLEELILMVKTFQVHYWRRNIDNITDNEAIQFITYPEDMVAIDPATKSFKRAIDSIKDKNLPEVINSDYNNPYVLHRALEIIPTINPHAIGYEAAFKLAVKYAKDAETRFKGAKVSIDAHLEQIPIEEFLNDHCRKLAYNIYSTHPSARR